MTVRTDRPPLRWIQTDGGPSIAVPDEARDLWQGSDPRGEGGSASDYDRACEAARFIGLVRSEGFVALAIVRGPLAWLPQGDSGVLVHWEYGDGKEAVEAWLRAAFAPGGTPPPWTPTGLDLPIPTGKLIVFDAAHRASEQGPAQHLLVTVPPGLHAIEQATFEPDDATSMTLYRFVRV